MPSTTTVILILRVLLPGENAVYTRMTTAGVADCAVRSLQVLQRTSEILPVGGGTVSVTCEVTNPKAIDN